MFTATRAFSAHTIYAGRQSKRTKSNPQFLFFILTETEKNWGFPYGAFCSPLWFAGFVAAVWGPSAAWVVGVVAAGGQLLGSLRSSSRVYDEKTA
ncbi:hypothetical protein KFU94_35570 [Chloroflexi bacterium TSY]|nr:hypothetical protein [Chloroflexi bacterium TSY]